MNQPVEGADLPSRPIANVDLDGTLANYSFAMMSALERMRSPNEPLLTEADLGDGPEWLEARKEFVKNRPGFWRDLKPIDLGMRVLDLIRACGYSINILTKGPLKTMIAWQEKVEWVRRYVPEATATVTEDKSIVYGRVLFDDWPKYIVPWLKYRPRGLVLMSNQPWNLDFFHPQVIRISGDPDFQRVAEALRHHAEL